MGGGGLRAVRQHLEHARGPRLDLVGELNVADPSQVVCVGGAHADNGRDDVWHVGIPAQKTVRPLQGSEEVDSFGELGFASRTQPSFNKVHKRQTVFRAVRIFIGQLTQDQSGVGLDVGESLSRELTGSGAENQRVLIAVVGVQRVVLEEFGEKFKGLGPVGAFVVLLGECLERADGFEPVHDVGGLREAVGDLSVEGVSLVVAPQTTEHVREVVAVGRRGIGFCDVAEGLLRQRVVSCSEGARPQNAVGLCDLVGRHVLSPGELAVVGKQFCEQLGVAARG